MLGLAIATLALLGLGFARSRHRLLQPFDLDGEWTVPAAFSSLLLVAAAVLVLQLRGQVVPRTVGALFAALLLFASLDEAVQLHERLERRVGIDWQQLYLPGFVVTSVIVSLLVLALRRIRLGVALALAAVAAWATSQVLEFVQWDVDRPVPNYTRLMLSEETLEMTGSALLILALLVALQSGRSIGRAAS